MKENETKNEIMEVKEEYQINAVENLNNNSKSTRSVFTTLTDKKKIFNLDNECDFKINECKGKEIELSDVLVKIYQREKEVLDDETMEVATEFERSMVCILIDKDDKSYVTASKMFTLQMINYIRDFGKESIKGTKIKIIEKSISNSSNKCLGFSLL
ncbi:MAG: hypothetical protein MJ224_01625 [archaeon]|nr:hypothetical protein [archaeon]